MRRFLQIFRKLFIFENDKFAVRSLHRAAKFASFWNFTCFRILQQVLQYIITPYCTIQYTVYSSRASNGRFDNVKQNLLTDQMDFIQNLKIIVGQNIVYIKVLQCSGAGVKLLWLEPSLLGQLHLKQQLFYQLSSNLTII